MPTLQAIEPILISVIIGLLTAGLLRLVFRGRNSGTFNLPPGPKPYPIIGNLLDLPKDKEWLTYRAMSEKYGDVVYLESFGQKLVILGSLAAIRDLMDRRGAVYSDRFAPLMCKELQYHHIQLSATHRLAKSLLESDSSPEVLPALIRDSVGKTIIKVMYGIDVKNSESEFITRTEKIVRAFAEAVIPGRFLVDFIPLLRYVPAWAPGAHFRRYAQDIAIDSRLMRDRPIAVVQASMKDGTAPSSVARAMLEDDATLPAEQSNFETIKDLAGLVYAAAADTTVSGMISFFLAMLVYPEVQVKAQKEIDSIVGIDRLPNYKDMARLPYTQAVVKECWRWIPVIPMGIPHATARDDEYKGYFIPKGTLVMGSAWSILHDPEAYPDPDTFWPDRFLDSDGHLDESVRDPRIAAFGFGRRVCPGRHFAEATQFMTVATVLATMDIVRAKGSDGMEVIPEVDVDATSFCYPKPFPWTSRPRSARARMLLDHALGLDG